MSNPPSSIEDAKLGTVNMGAKARMMDRKQRLGLIAGLVLGLALLVSLPLAVVYGLRSRRNSEVKIEETSEDSVLCSPKAYSAGQWVWDPKTNITEMTSKEQALLFSGFETCANDMLSWWNLGANLPEKYFRLPKAQSYRWEPGSKCQGLSPLDPGALLKHLVEIGGWYIVGGSFPLFLVLLVLIDWRLDRFGWAKSFLLHFLCPWSPCHCLAREPTRGFSLWSLGSFTSLPQSCFCLHV